MRLADVIESAEEPLPFVLPLDLEQELAEYFHIFTTQQEQAQ